MKYIKYFLKYISGIVNDVIIKIFQDDYNDDEKLIDSIIVSDYSNNYNEYCNCYINLNDNDELIVGDNLLHIILDEMIKTNCKIIIDINSKTTDKKIIKKLSLFLNSNYSENVEAVVSDSIEYLNELLYYSVSHSFYILIKFLKNDKSLKEKTNIILHNHFDGLYIEFNPCTILDKYNKDIIVGLYNLGPLDNSHTIKCLKRLGIFKYINTVNEIIDIEKSVNPN